MKKLLKILGIILVLLVIVAVAAPMLISKDMVKQQLIAQVEAATGRKLTIGGDMSVRVFPFAGVTMENVALSDVPGSDKYPFVAIKSLDVNVEVMPLLSKHIVIKNLTLNEPIIRLHKNAAGKGNWEFESRRVAAASEISESKTGARLSGNFQLSELKITGGTLSFLDDTRKRLEQLTEVNMSVSLEGMNQPLSVDGSAIWEHKTVKIKASIDSLADFLNKKKSSVVASASSDFFEMNFAGTAAEDNYSGQMKLKSSSLAALLNWVQSDAKPVADKKLAFDMTGEVACNISRCDFSNTTVNLDDIKAQGKAGVNFSGAKPVITAEFATDRLDLNPFLPPKAKTQAGILISNAYAAEGWSREPMDFSGLNAANANVAVSAKQVLVRDIKLADAKLHAVIQDGQLKADMPGVSLYNGKGSFSMGLSSSGSLRHSMKLAGVQAEPFLTDALQQDRLSGTANADLQLSGQGKSMYELIASLDGNGSVKFTDGAIKGVDIAGMVRNVQSAFKEVDRSSQKTDFAELGGTFTIANGIVKNSDLAMKAPLMRLSGAGEVNLPAQTVNYRLKPEIVETIQGQGGKDKTGIGVPILITGSFDNLHYAPDLQATIQEAIENPEKVKETVKNVKEQFKGENRKEMLRDLRGLIKPKN